MRIFVFNLFFLLSVSLMAQSPFTLDAKKEWIMLGAGFGIYTAGLIYEQNIDPLSKDEILNLEQKFGALDEWAIRQYSRSARLGSDVGLGLGNLAPVLLFTSSKTKGDKAKIAVMYLETMSWTLAVTGWTKRLVLRPRPFTYNPEVDFIKKTTRNARFSFFSGHTSTCAAASFFTASVWTKYNPDSKWKIPVWTFAAALPAVTGLLRVHAGKHFPSDVMTGYAVGAGMGLLIPWLHRSKPIFSGRMKLNIAPNMLHFQMNF